MNDTLLTARQVAERTGYDARHVRLLIRQGHLPAQRLGPMWYVTEADFKEFQETYTPEHHGWRRGWKRSVITDVPAAIAEQVRQVRALRAAGHAQREVANRFGKSTQWVHRIEHRKTWAAVDAEAGSAGPAPDGRIRARSWIFIVPPTGQAIEVSLEQPGVRQDAEDALKAHLGVDTLPEGTRLHLVLYAPVNDTRPTAEGE